MADAEVRHRGELVRFEQDLGPGIDVLIGNRFKKLPKKAPKRVPLPDPVETCVDVN